VAAQVSSGSVMRAVVFLVLLGCGGRGGGSADERAFCARIDKLCDAELTARDIEDCSRDIRTLEKPLGDAYPRMLSCGVEASSCMEAIGCLGGAAKVAGDDAMRDLERGFERMTRRARDKDDKQDEGDRPRRSRQRDSKPLPVECRRADEVCDPDEPFARKKCREMIGNLRADPGNRARLVRCYERANNCFAFERCTTELWFELQ
jgi:hypothetical protein